MLVDVPDKGDLRRHQRTEVQVAVQVVWEDRRGQKNFANGKSIDISEAGMRLKLKDPIEKQTYVSLSSPQLSLNGQGSVRTCARAGNGFIVGIEFSAGLKWKTGGKPAGPPKQ